MPTISAGSCAVPADRLSGMGFRVKNCGSARSGNSTPGFSRVTLHHLQDEDDDVVTFEFGAPDPAVAPFSKPKAPPTKIATPTELNASES